MNRESAARELHARGWTPVPVERGSKKPRGAAWQRRTVSDAEIPDLFSGDGNIGLLTGSLSGGLCDIDLDCPEALALARAFLPETPMHSGHGSNSSSHFWYQIDGAIPGTIRYTDIDRDRSVLLELRTDGHQTLVPPSVHPDGDTYRWDGDLTPQRVAGAALVRAAGRLATVALLVRQWPRTPGSRHQIANALAGMLLLGGWTEGETEEFVGIVADAADDEEAHDRARAAVATARSVERGENVTGGPSLAVLLDQRIVERAREWLELSNARTLQAASGSAVSWSEPAAFYRIAVPEFPSHCLPGWLRAFVEELGVATQTPMAMAGGLALSVVALTIARRIRIEIRHGWDEPTNLFTATSMAPGNRKSAVFAAITAPIVQHERNEAERLAPEIQKAEGRRRILAKALKDAEKSAAKAEIRGTAEGLPDVERVQTELASVIVPLRPRFFTDDVTAEALSKLIDKHAGRFAVLSAEGGVFELMAGRYGNNGSPNFDVYLKGHAGDSLRVDRVQRDGELVDVPALTIGLAFQPEVLRALATKPGFRGRGLLGRFLYSLPRSLVGQRQIGAPAVSEMTRSLYSRNILALLRETSQPVDAAHPPCIRLEPEALDAMATFERWLEPRLAVDAQLGTLADWASKLAGAVARIAAVLHAASIVNARRAVETPIPVETISNAIELGRFYLRHAQAAFAEMGADPEVERANQVLGWLRRKNITSFTVRDAFQDLKGRFQKVSELRPALQLLVEHGYLRPAPSEPRAGPGRPPSERFEVNPLWNRNSEDIENIEEATQDLNLDDLSSQDSSSASTDDSKSIPDVPPQNPQNPQNSDSSVGCDPDDEAVL